MSGEPKVNLSRNADGTLRIEFTLAESVPGLSGVVFPRCTLAPAGVLSAPEPPAPPNPCEDEYTYFWGNGTVTLDGDFTAEQLRWVIEQLESGRDDVERERNER